MALMNAPVRVTGPGQSLVSLAEVKAHCRIDSTEEDTFLLDLINAATAYLDGYSGILGRALLPQTWRQDFNYFEDRLRLPVGPVSAVTLLAYRDADDVTQTLASTSYVLLKDDIGSYVALTPGSEWPAVGKRENNIQITYTAGSTDVPASIKLAALFMIASWFSDRTAGSIPPQSSALLAPFRTTLT